MVIALSNIFLQCALLAPWAAVLDFLSRPHCVFALDKHFIYIMLTICVCVICSLPFSCSCPTIYFSFLQFIKYVCESVSPTIFWGTSPYWFMQFNGRTKLARNTFKIIIQFWETEGKKISSRGQIWLELQLELEFQSCRVAIGKRKGQSQRQKQI